MCIARVVLAVCVLFQAVQLGSSYGSYELQKKLDKLKDHLKTLDRKLDTLDHRFHNLQQYLHGLSDFQYKGPFQITRVEKIEAIDFFKVTVRYQGSPRPDSILVDVPDKPLQKLEQSPHGDVTFNILKGPNQDEARILFYLPDRFLKARLQMTDTAVSMDIPAIHLEVLQGTEVKFQPGQNVQLDFISYVDGSRDSVSDDQLVTQVLIPSQAEDNMIERHTAYFYRSEDAPVRMTGREFEGRPGRRYGRVVLNFTEEDAEGMADMFYEVRFSCYQNCLVNNLQEKVGVMLYQEGGEAPFPKDTISFVHEDTRGNTSQVYCKATSDCQLSCEAIGNDLTRIQLTRVESQGVNESTSGVSVISGAWGRSELQFFNVSFSDSGDYLCTVTSENGEASERQTLVVVQAARIIRKLSNGTHFDNGTVLLTCVAEGKPAPDVTLTVRYPDIQLPEPHVTHPSQWQTKVDFVITDHETVIDVMCFATNVEGVSTPADNTFWDRYRIPVSEPSYMYYDDYDYDYDYYVY